MPRDGSGIYTQPLPDVVPATTIASTVYNGFVNDVETDLNQPRPIIAGGTGATNATTALYNVGGEKATQVVTNWDSQVWVPGSFYAAASATGSSPTAGRAFAGTVYIGETLANPPTNQNVVLEARDLDYPTQPGPLYARQKKAGVWSAWTSGGGSAAPFDALAYNGIQINGSAEVSQESGANLISAINNQHIVDGFKVYAAGPVVAAQQVADGPPGFTSSIKITVTTSKSSLAATDYALIHTNIEGYRSSRLAFSTANAQPLTIAFWTKIHRAGLYSGAVRNNADNRSYPFTFTQNVADTWEYKIVTLTGDTTGTWVTNNGIGLKMQFAMAMGTTYQGTDGVWAAALYQGATGTTNGVAATSDTFQITGVVVLPGIQAPTAAQSPFIMRPYGQELEICRRYWQNEASLPRVQVNSPTAANNVTAIYIPLKPVMRASPVITTIDPPGARGKVGMFTANGITPLSIIINPNGFYVTGQDPGTTAVSHIEFAYEADARL